MMMAHGSLDPAPMHHKAANMMMLHLLMLPSVQVSNPHALQKLFAYMYHKTCSTHLQHPCSTD